MAASLDNLQDWLIAIAQHTRETKEAIEGKGNTGGATGNTSGGSLAALAKSATSAQAAMGSFVSSFDKAISALGSGMSRFVQLANPGVVLRFNMAVENAMSALGRILMPALQTATGLIQQMGNALESLSPRAKQLVAGMVVATGVAAALGAAVAAIGAVAAVAGGPVAIVVALAAAMAGLVVSGSAGGKAAESFRNVLKAFGTALEAVGAILQPVVESILIPVLNDLATTLRHTADGVIAVVNRLRALGGLDPLKYDPDAKTAAAARNAQIGDLRGAANRAYTSAYNTAGGGAGDPAKDTAKNTAKTASVLEKIYNAWSATHPFNAHVTAAKLYDKGIKGFDRSLPGSETSAGIGRSIDRMWARLF
jgi:hypothetical protein